MKPEITDPNTIITMRGYKARQFSMILRVFDSFLGEMKYVQGTSRKGMKW